MTGLCARALLRTGLLCLVPLAGASALAGAQELILGWEGDSLGGNGFVMPVFSMPKAGKNAFVLRGSAGYLYYTIRSGTSQTDVTSPGGSFGLAWRARGKKATFTLGPGFEVRRKTSTPDSGPSTEVTEKGFTVAADVYCVANPLTSLYAILSYADANQYAWGRAGFKRQVTNRRFEKPTAWSVGLEITGQGNDEVHTYQAGAVAGLAFLRRQTSLEVRFGYSQRRYPAAPSDHQLYVGVGLYHNFTR
jgi:hypothetical protein